MDGVLGGSRIAKNLGSMLCLWCGDLGCCVQQNRYQQAMMPIISAQASQVARGLRLKAGLEMHRFTVGACMGRLGCMQQK